MSNTSSNNSYPSATAPIAEVFGFNKPKKDHGHGSAEAHAETHDAHAPAESAPAHAPAPAGLPVAHLPVVENHEEVHAEAKPATKPAHKSPIEEKIAHMHEAETSHAADSHASDSVSHDSHASTTAPATPVWQRALKTAAPYVLIFVAGLFAYFYFFNKVDFSKLFESKSKTTQVLSSKDSELEKLKKNNLDAYNKWIATYYYDVSDAGILDPNADNSGNGLSNFQKFLLNLNPKSYSTLGIGKPDSELLAEGINPLSGTPLNDKQKEIVDKYFDMEVIMNKLLATSIQSSGQVAGASTTNPFANQFSPRGSLPGQSIQQQSAQVTIEPSPNVPSNEVDIDYSIPGRLEIPSLGVNAPLIWTQDPKNFENDLKNGVVHYPGTAVPGQIGTTYISGHSSNYIWVKSDYNHVFTKLDQVPDYGSFKITVVQKNGKDAIFHYVVKSRKEYSPSDQEQFRNAGVSQVALSTCWPVGTTKNRLVLFGELTQVEK